MGLGSFLRLFKGRRRQEAGRRPFSAAPMMPGQPIVLGGRRFHLVEVGSAPIRHYNLYSGLLAEIGLDDPHRIGDETAEDYVRRLLHELLVSRKSTEVLGYLLIPDGSGSEDWTPEMAAGTTEFIEGLTGADVTAYQSLTISWLSAFFEQGLSSWGNFPISLDQPETAKPEMSPPGIPVLTDSGAR
jgi:hypothetical protein